jgi:hypothetical protein
LWCAKTFSNSDNILLNIPSRVIRAAKLKKIRILIISTIEGDNFFGMKAMNKCEYFQNISDIEEFLKGCEIGYNTDLVNTRIAYHQKEIDKIKKRHEII